MASARVHIAVLTIAIPPAAAVAIESIVADSVTAAGHDITAFEAVRDSEVAISAQLVGWIADPEIDLVIVIAGGEATSAALKPLIDQPLPGFTDLIRALTDRELAGSKLASAAEVARCDSTFVFVLPANAIAVRAVMETVILPQLDPRTEPTNLIPSLPRLSEVTRVDVTTIDANLAAEAKKLPGRALKPTGKNLVAREVDAPTKPIDIEKLEHELGRTKPIDLDKLERQLELSKTTGDTTKPMDLGKLASNQKPPRSQHPIGVAKAAAPTTSPAPTAPTAKMKAVAGPLPSIVAGDKKAAPVAERELPPSGPVGRRKVSQSTPPPSSVDTSRAQPTTAPTARPASSAPAAPEPSLASSAAASPRTPPAIPVARTEPPPPDELETIDPDELHEEPHEEPEANEPDEWPIPAAVAAALPAPPAPIPASPREPIAASAPVSVPPVATSTPTLAPPRPVSSPVLDELPIGSFEVPNLKRSRAPVIGLLLLAIVLGGGGAFLLMNRADDEPAQVAETTVDASIAAVEPDAAPSSEPAGESPSEPLPEIEIEPESVASAEVAPGKSKSRKSRRNGKRDASAPETSTEPEESSAPDPEKASSDPKPVRAAPGCAEVECVLEDYKRPCCERFKPTGEGYRPSVESTDSLQKAQIKAGMAKVRARVMDCGEKFPVKGTVKLAVSVGPEGQVTELSVQTSPADDLGSCVAAAARKATFAKTESGGSFTYPFVF